MQTISIGRTDENTIVLNQPNVSRKHAVITQLDSGEIFIEDLNSTNGTFVNGNKITKVKINLSDTVTIGGTTVNWQKFLYNQPKTVVQEQMPNINSNSPSQPQAIAPPVSNFKPQIPKKKNKGLKIFLWIFFSIIFILGCFVLFYFISNNQKNKMNKDLRNYVFLVKGVHDYAITGGVNYFNYSIKNESDYTINKVSVNVEAFNSNTNKTFCQETEVFYSILPHSTSEEKSFTCERGNAVNCEILSIDAN